MCSPQRWLPGLIPLFLLFLAAVGLKVPEIRHDLTERAASAVEAAGLAKGTVEVSGRDVTLRGMTFSAQGQAKAIASADAVNGVRLVTNGVDLPAVAKPFSLEAARKGDTIILTGSVPDPETRASIVAAAKAIAPKVDDKLVYARGAAAGFGEWSVAAMAPLAKLTEGNASLVDGALSVTGQAADSGSYQAALAATKGLPTGLTLAKADIKPPLVSPYVWSAISDGKGVMLEGYVPSDAARASIAAAAKAALPGYAITDHMQIAQGGAAGFPGWTQAGLAALGRLSRGEASLSGSALTISGEAPDEASYAAALAATRALPAGLTLAKADISPPVVAPYTWSAGFDGKTLTLDGFVPSEDARAAVLAAAKANEPGAQIVDRMRVARGAPRDFVDAAGASLGALGKLAAGKASLSDLQLSLSGTTRGGESLDSLKQGLFHALPAGFDSRANLAYPEKHPFLFSAVKDPHGPIIVSGYAPSEGTRQGAIAVAHSAGMGVSGTIDLASGLPDGIDFERSVALGMSVLAPLQHGDIKLGEDGLTIHGVGDPNAVAAGRAALSAPPPGVRIKLADLTALAPPPPPPPPPPPVVVAPPPPVVVAPPPAPKHELTETEAACQKQLVDRLAQSKINFRTSSADVAPDSTDLIRELAKVLLGCPDVKFEIAGHTDNVGDHDMNKELSLARAKSVVAALSAAGVAADRMTAAGYGPDRPIAPNDTREGRALNRRTEFVVK